MCVCYMRGHTACRDRIIIAPVYVYANMACMPCMPLACLCALCTVGTHMLTCCMQGRVVMTHIHTHLTCPRQFFMPSLKGRNALDVRPSLTPLLPLLVLLSFF